MIHRESKKYSLEKLIKTKETAMDEKQEVLLSQNYTETSEVLPVKE